MMLAIMVLIAPQQAFAEKRVALVIGNGDYEGQPLLNPRNDAHEISVLLSGLDFQVFEGSDLDFAGMNDAFGTFMSALDGADVALLFYAGHGVQLDNENYLIPTDNPVRTESDIHLKSIKISTVVKAMERSARTSITLLDACRNNPFEQQLKNSMGQARSASLGRGLANMEAGNGSMIVFATAPNKIAFDGAGDHSPFTDALMRHLATQGQSLLSGITKVTADVYRATNARQRPYTTMSLLEEVYLAADSAPRDSGAEIAIAPTETVAQASQISEPEPQNLTVSDKKASRDEANPVNISPHEIVNGRVGPDRYDFWSVTLLPGKYRMVMDGESTDVLRTEYFDMQFLLPDGTQFAPRMRGRANPRHRYTRTFEIGAKTTVHIGIGDTTKVMKYALVFVPEDTDVPTPYLSRDVQVRDLAQGQLVTANVAGSEVNDEVWYKLPLEASDYDITVQFKSLAAKHVFVQGWVGLFDSLADVTQLGGHTACLVSGPNKVEGCKFRASLIDPQNVYLQLLSGKDPYEVSVMVTEVD